MLHRQTGSSRLCKYLHDGICQEGFNVFGAKLYDKQPVLTCLEVR